MKTIKVINQFGNVYTGTAFGENTSKNCVLYFPGFGQTRDKFCSEIKNSINNNGIDFIYCETNWEGTQKSIPRYKNGNLIRINSGACYSDVNMAKCDFDVWINWAKTRYENIHLVTYCLTCSKLLNYLQEGDIPAIKSISFIAPQDNSIIKDAKAHEGLFEEAIYNINNNQENKILSKFFLKFTPITSKTFYQICAYPFLNNFPYHTQNGNFYQLKNIEKPILIVMGSNDKGLCSKNITLSAEQCLDKISKYNKCCNTVIIEDAKHSFKDKEKELANVISRFIIKGKNQLYESTK